MARPGLASTPRHHSRRLWLAALGALALAVGAFVVWRFEPGTWPYFPPCPLHALTGLHCAGCGMTRAAHALLHGRLGHAVAFNPLAALVVPMWVALRVWERWRRAASPWTGHPRFARGMLILVVVYSVGRNLPWYPFTLLAPGGFDVGP